MYAASVVIAVALGFLVFKGLGNATVYFRTADEAVARRAELGTRRFRIEGVVVPASVREAGGVVDFAIESKGVKVDVVHRGDQPPLFKDNMPVVLEGRWQGSHYASDRIMVKHSESYRVKNPERVQDYQPAGS
jgi:cytochrome c-type biogenesis protein CcmE